LYLNDGETWELEKLIVEFYIIFTTKSDGYGRTDRDHYCINIGNICPTYQPPHRYPTAKQTQADEMMKDMKGHVVTEESDSPDLCLLCLSGKRMETTDSV
jgi:hypothetical protein